jgi:hypothetical protein
MGEAFKHHSQALIGYVDDIADMATVSAMPSALHDQTMMGMEATY